MPIRNSEKSLKEIYNQVNDKIIVLPRFQRGFVWNRDKQRSLVASFLVDLPFGSLLSLTGHKGDFITRNLCYAQLTDDIQDNVEYVLDGQQRLSVLRSVLYDLFDIEGRDWQETWDLLYSSLRNRWFLRLKPEQEEEDIFGFRNLRFREINKITDADINDFVEHKKIFKGTTNFDLVYHPEFSKRIDECQDPKERAALKIQRVRWLAEKHLIPLYEVNLGDGGLHIKVLDKIAEDRTSILKQELEEEEELSADLLLKYFQGIKGLESMENADELLQEVNEENVNLNDYWATLKAKWVEKFTATLNNLIERKLPIIQLDRDEINRAIAIFEAINKGGVGLSVFDLVVAKSASEQNADLVSKAVEILESEIDVPDHISDSHGVTWRSSNLNTLDGKEPIQQIKEWFVNILSLLVFKEEQNGAPIGVNTIKREYILSISAANVNNFTDQAFTGLIRALCFLNLKAGIIKADDVVYKLLVVVIAFYLADDDVWNNSEKIKKIQYWYWLAIFSGKYAYRQNERCIEDIKNMGNFLNGENPDIFRQWQSRLLDTEEVNLAILTRETQDDDIEPTSFKKALMQYLLSIQPFDFNSEQEVKLKAVELSKTDTKVEIHHIIPLTTATKIEESTKNIREDKNHLLNSALNLTPISRIANQKIKDRSPTEYLDQLNNNILSSHCIATFKHAHTSDEEIKARLNERYQLLLSSLNQKLNSLI